MDDRSSMPISHPPERVTPNGRPRRAGVELAFAGLDLEDAAARVQKQFGGAVRRLSSCCFDIEGTRHGTFTARRDAPVDTDHPEPRGAAHTRRQTRDASATLAGFVTPDADRLAPVELSCPPIPYQQLDAIERLLEELRLKGAVAEGSTLVHAVGLELEPEAGSLETGRILPCLKAYALICDWLRKDTANDNISDVLPVPSPFPMEYRQLLADPGYAPDGEAFLADYLAANPTRDRELDLYPLFLHIHGPRDEIAEALGEATPHPRPFYRYRLPRGAVARGGGRVTDEWNQWVRVERLAADPERLADMGRAFLSHGGEFVRGDWADESERWLA